MEKRLNGVSDRGVVAGRAREVAGNAGKRRDAISRGR